MRGQHRGALQRVPQEVHHPVGDEREADDEEHDQVDDEAAVDHFEPGPGRVGRAGEGGRAVLAHSRNAADDDVLVKLHVAVLHCLGQRVVGCGDLGEKPCQVRLVLRELAAHRLQRLQLGHDLGVVVLEEAPSLGRQVVQGLQEGLELRRVLGQDRDRLGQVRQRGGAGAAGRGERRGETVQAIDGLGDVARVLRVAVGHRRQVGQEGLERGLLAREPLTTGLNDLLELGRGDGAEDLRPGLDELLHVGDQGRVRDVGPVCQLRRRGGSRTRLVLGNVELHELIAEDGGAVDGRTDIGGDVHAVVESQGDLGLVPVEGDGLHGADGHIGHLHLGPTGEIAHVGEDGSCRALTPSARDGAAGQRQHERTEQGQHQQAPPPGEAVRGARIRTTPPRRAPTPTQDFGAREREGVGPGAAGARGKQTGR